MQKHTNPAATSAFRKAQVVGPIRSFIDVHVHDGDEFAAGRCFRCGPEMTCSSRSQHDTKDAPTSGIGTFRTWRDVRPDVRSWVQSGSRTSGPSGQLMTQNGHWLFRADYYLDRCYLVRDATTKKCTIVDRKPTTTTSIVDIGVDEDQSGNRHEDHEGPHGKLTLRSAKASQTIDGPPRCPICCPST